MSLKVKVKYQHQIHIILKILNLLTLDDHLKYIINIIIILYNINIYHYLIYYHNNIDGVNNVISKLN